MERDPGRRLRRVPSIPPSFAVTKSDLDLDFSGKGKLGKVAALKGRGDDGVGGGNFN